MILRNSRFFWLLLVLLLWRTDPAVAFYGRTPGRDAADGRYVPPEAFRRKYGFSFQRRGNGSILLHNNQFNMQLQGGKRICRLNGCNLYLAYAPLSDRDGRVWVHENDLRNVVGAFFRETPRSFFNNKKPLVLLDPGHGGSEPGAIAGDVLEKDINLKIASQVANLLRRAGVEVKMTRSDDRYLSLEARSHLATELNADIFVSIHQNSAGNAGATGIETFAMTPVGGGSPNGKELNPGNRFDRNSLVLAHFIQSSVLINGNQKAIDRGVKRAAFRVLRKSDVVAAALIECGFISNAGERKKLSDNTCQAGIAGGIANGIIKFLQQRTRE